MAGVCPLGLKYPLLLQSQYGSGSTVYIGIAVVNPH